MILVGKQGLVEKPANGVWQDIALQNKRRLEGTYTDKSKGHDSFFFLSSYKI